MEIVLHIGCHRSATTTFQAYLRANALALSREQIAFWGPQRTRGRLFHGLIPSGGIKPGRSGAIERARRRVRLNIEQARVAGKRAVLVSDADMIGTVRSNLKARALYPAIGERMARYNEAFDGQITRIALAIRSHDRYWASALANGIARGRSVPTEDTLSQIAASERGWREVITDLACAVPDTEICVLPYEAYAGDPRALLHDTCKLSVPVQGSYDRLMKNPTLRDLRGILAERGESVDQLPRGVGPWQPFDTAQLAHMQDTFQDDLFWLAAGAGGLATLTEEERPGGRGKAHRHSPIRGQTDAHEGYVEKLS